MKKTFEYDLTKYDPNAPTRTEQFLTADGVKTLTTDANNGAVLIQDSVDPDSLNPVTAAAVATAVASASGEVPVIGDGDNGKVLKAVVDGSSKSVTWGVDNDTTYTAGTNISINDGVISATDTTYTAGNMVSITNGAIGVSTTAGITDVQQVAALPAEPVSTVLYIIPET